jgi:hypothetical protein
VRRARDPDAGGIGIAILGVGVDEHRVQHAGPMRLSTHVTGLPDDWPPPGRAAGRLAVARDHDGHRHDPRILVVATGESKVTAVRRLVRARRSALAVLVPAHAPEPRPDCGSRRRLVSNRRRLLRTAPARAGRAPLCKAARTCCPAAAMRSTLPPPRPRGRAAPDRGLHVARFRGSRRFLLRPGPPPSMRRPSRS